MTTWNRASFKATHNSYSGGGRGSIFDQLNAGVRLIELDLHAGNFAAVGDYQIGHDDPDDEVSHDGTNPPSVALQAWLAQIFCWSVFHSTHSPIVLLLDCKDALGGIHSILEGNFAALNRELLSTFGRRLLRADELAPSWPEVDAVRGRVLAVLSGDGREYYLYDSGARPAVAINAAGQVIEVHDSGHGTLWYWTGQLGADGNVTWARHGYYDTGMDPAVALTEDGYIVEVHKSEAHDTLWYHVGQLTPELDVAWSASHQYDQGVHPTVHLLPDGTLREIHRSQNNDQRWQWVGRLDRSARTVAWSANTRTNDAFDKTTAVSTAGRVAVTCGVEPGAPSDTLSWSANGGNWNRIRYAQVALVDLQNGDAAWRAVGARFASAIQGDDVDFLRAQQDAGLLTRIWSFDVHARSSLQVNYPATDDLGYLLYMMQVGAVD